MKSHCPLLPHLQNMPPKAVGRTCPKKQLRKKKCPTKCWKEVSSRIFTFRQPYRITSGWIIYSQLLYWVIQPSWFARVNVLCNLSCKKLREVAAHFWADFWVGIASRCVQQWKVNPELRSSTNANIVAVAKLLWKGDRGWKKGVCVIFWLTRRSWVQGKNAFWGIL